MLFVRDTSQGIVVLDVGHNVAGGIGATFFTLNGDGWAEESGTWSAKWDQEGNRRTEGSEEGSLADALVKAIGLASSEAAELAPAALSGFEGRGGVEQGRANTARGLALVTAIGLGVLAVVAVLVLLILLVVGVLS